MKYCFGVDVGGTTVKMGLFEENGTITDKWEITTDTSEEGKAILPNIAASVKKKIEEHQLAKDDIAGIGVGVPAPVTADGVVNGSANLGWKYKEVKKELEELTGLTAAIGNDANVAALGEMWKGGGAGEKNMIMVTLGTGVGGGVIIDGKMLVGQNGAGGEIGHLCVNYEETDRCGCGNRGCLEQYASATGIVRLAKQKLGQEMRPTILNKEDVTAKDVFDNDLKLQKNNEKKVAQENLEAAKKLAAELAEVCQAFLLTQLERGFRTLDYYQQLKVGM